MELNQLFCLLWLYINTITFGLWLNSLEMKQDLIALAERAEKENMDTFDRVEHIYFLKQLHMYL